MNNMDHNDFFVVTLDSPSYFPDIQHHKPNVLDVTIIRIGCTRFEIQNLNELSSDHNPVLLDIHGQDHPISNLKPRTLTN